MKKQCREGCSLDPLAARTCKLLLRHPLLQLVLGSFEGSESLCGVQFVPQKLQSVIVTDFSHPCGLTPWNPFTVFETAQNYH